MPVIYLIWDDLDGQGDYSRLRVHCCVTDTCTAAHFTQIQLQVSE